MDVNDTMNYSEFSYQCRNPTFGGLLGFQTSFLAVTNLFAIFVNFTFLRVLHYCPTFHPNVHFLLQNISCGLLCHSLQGVMQSVYNTILFVVGYKKVFNKTSLCVVFQSLNIISSASIMFTFLAIGVERFIFTETRIAETKVVEKSSVKIRVVAVLTWFFGLPPLIEPIINPRNDKVCYCTLAYVTQTLDLSVTTIVYIAVQLAAIISFPIVHHLNKRQLAKFKVFSTTHSLVEKTRAWRNVRTTMMILPSAILQGLIFVTSFILIVSTQSYVLNVDKGYSLDIKIATLCFQLFSIFNILHPILCVRHHHLLAVAAKEKSTALYWLSCWRSTITQVDVVGEIENFSVDPTKQQNLLSNFWNNFEVTK